MLLKMTPAEVFSCKFWEFIWDTFLVEHLRTAASNREFFLETFRKFQNILRVPCIWHILSLLRLSRKARTSYLIKNLYPFEEEANAHVLLSFVCSTNEFKDYSDKPFKTEICSKTVKEQLLFMPYLFDLLLIFIFMFIMTDRIISKWN